MKRTIAMAKENETFTAGALAEIATLLKQTRDAVILAGIAVALIQRK
jgi:hypothetical protein